MSDLFSKTRRKTDGDDGTAAELLVRAGFIRQLAAGIYSLLPLAVRVTRRIEGIIHEEMRKIGGQEVFMPVVQPSDIWKTSGRWYEIGDELSRFKDRYGRDMALAMTHEEVVADLVKSEIHSYRQLPGLIYHIQTKWRDDARPRAGLIRVREFTMTDSYSLDRDAEGMHEQYRRHFEAYQRIYERCGLPVCAVEGDQGIMGGPGAHEFMYETAIGEDTIVYCTECTYRANQQIAGSTHEYPEKEEQKATERVHTPGCSTIEALAEYLNIEPSRCAKAVFMRAAKRASPGTESDEFDVDHEIVVAVVPGNRAVNETKLAKAVGASSLIPATDEEIRSVGIEPGYGSPVGASGAKVVVDAAIPEISNMVAGSNEADYHLTGVNFGRDYDANIVADITSTEAGDACLECGSRLDTYRAVEVGNIFKLGTRYSDSFDCTFLDENGDRKPVQMGSYGIGNGRLLACIAEEHRDEAGLVWPTSVAPFDIHIVDLTSGDERVEHLYRSLIADGFAVLMDDRPERAGVKFNDADLIGVPVRITAGERSLAKGSVEIVIRKNHDKNEVAIDEVTKFIRGISNDSVRSVSGTSSGEALADRN